MLTILPRPCAIMCRPAAWQRKKTRLQIGVDHRVPVLLAEIDRVGAADDAGIVDQDVEPAELGDASRSTTPRDRRDRRRGRPRSSSARRAQRARPAPRSRRRAVRPDQRDVRARLGQRDARSPWPMPVLAPVTSATLPVRSNETASLQLADVEDVHVGIVLILAGHRPDEGVGPGARAHVDRPGRRDHRFLVRDHDVPHRLAFAHIMEDAVVLAVGSSK